MSSVQFKVNKKEIDKLIKFNKMLKTRGVKDLKNQMFKAAVDFRNDVIRSMQNTAKDATKTYKYGHHPSKPGHPPAIDTSNALTSMQVRSIRVGAEFFIFGAPYMEAHEFGVNHSWTIRAKNKKVLSDGKNIFGTEVVHPGLPERPFIRPQIKKGQRGWEKMFKRSVWKDIQRFSR